MQVRTTLRHLWVATVLSVSVVVLPTVHAETAPPAVVLPDFSEIVEKTEKSVVNIRTTESVPSRPSMNGGRGDPYDLFRWFFGPDAVPGPGGRGQPSPHGGGEGAEAPEERVVPRGVGSGFVISNDGYILTNNHVIADAKDIFVTLVEGKEYKAEVIGTDERTDIALIKVKADDDLVALDIGRPADLKKGQWVMAIGSPFGLDSTVTVGIVSAINRDTGEYLPFIQTDVAVNPGNSGGPLLNMEGEVVGVNSQIVSRSGGFMGISLAIPIDEAMSVVDQLKAHGKVTRGKIGVQITEVGDEVASALGLKDNKGALVSSVEEDGPAAQAGIRSGDVILSFGDKTINQMSDLPRIVGAVKPGTKVKMKVWRKGKTVTVKAEVGELTTGGPAAPEQPEPASDYDRLGLQVKALSKSELKAIGVAGGVKVTAASGPAAQVGISEGDILLQINDHDELTVKSYNQVVKSLSAGENTALLILRGSNAQWVLVKPAE